MVVSTPHKSGSKLRRGDELHFTPDSPLPPTIPLAPDLHPLYTYLPPVNSLSSSLISPSITFFSFFVRAHILFLAVLLVYSSRTSRRSTPREAPEKPPRLGHNKRAHALERPAVDQWPFSLSSYLGPSPPFTGGHGVERGSSAVVAPRGT